MTARIGFYASNALCTSCVCGTEPPFLKEAVETVETASDGPGTSGPVSGRPVTQPANLSRYDPGTQGRAFQRIDRIEFSGATWALGKHPQPDELKVSARRLLSVRFDDLDLDEALALLVARDPAASFAYVVTPNADHLLRLERGEPSLRAVYEAAWLSLCDSRILRLLAGLHGITLKLAAGSDLIAALFDRVISPDMPVTLIGGSAHVAARIRARYGLRQLAHYNPPMGFIANTAEVDACVAFAAAHPADFVILGVGSPRQEILAARIAASGRATGTGLCVGAALEFLAGVKRRAPAWMQKAHLEWLYRLLREPHRLWRRYLLEAPRLLWLMHDVGRQKAAAV